ncbi:MAG: cytochrome c oxidase assembly protein, partial [Acidobacteriota bacterium]|nr:cytochrome c oxidase assembly protein [Acidobacteriota bacterium]
MDPLANAALTSWALNAPAIGMLILTAAIYVRGWLRGRRLLHQANDYQQLWSFLGGLAVVFLATESPLDAFDSLFLSAHMAQHLLLMMFAPPLILLGDPTLPLLRGLPKRFVKENLGPFLTWSFFRRLAGLLTLPPVTWCLFAFSTIFWHLPKFYELALSSSTWHGVQHASFFWTGVLFWWPVIEPGHAKSKWPLWTKIPYLLFGDIVNTVVSAMFVFSGRLLYPSYEAVRASSFSAQDDQTVAGLIMWVPGSIVYLIPAFVIAMRLLSPVRVTRRVEPIWPPSKRKSRSFPIRFKLPQMRRGMQVVMLLVAVAVIVDGLFGPQVTPLNLAGVLPWIQWRGLSILALLVVGNLFCMACPFTFVRDIGRKVLPAKFRWPRMLRNKWLPTGLLVLYFWSYEAFSLWDSPFATAWIIIGYFVAALVIDGFFRGASFCKYVCPIGQFHFVTSLVSPREVRIKSSSTCVSCQTYDCIRGNQQARGCELYLFQPKKEGSLDCTFCLDCVKACPHDNVAILPVLPARTIISDSYRSSIGKLSKRTDLAALALVFVFGAFANAAGMVSPVMMWEHRWHARLGAHAMPLIIGAFILASAVLIPAAAVLLCGLANRLTSKSMKSTADFARRLVFTLVPLGVAMWAAHLLYHFATGWLAPWLVVQHRFLLVQGQIQIPGVPSWLTAAQILLLDTGLG